MSSDEDFSDVASSPRVSSDDDEWDPDSAPTRSKGPSAKFLGHRVASSSTSTGGTAGKKRRLSTPAVPPSVLAPSDTVRGGGGGSGSGGGGSAKKGKASKGSSLLDAHTFTDAEVMGAVHALKKHMQATASKVSGGGGRGSSSSSSSSSTSADAPTTCLALGMTGALEVQELAPPEVRLVGHHRLCVGHGVLPLERLNTP